METDALLETSVEKIDLEVGEGFVDKDEKDDHRTPGNPDASKKGCPRVTFLVAVVLFISVFHTFIGLAGFQNIRQVMINDGIFHGFCSNTTAKNETCPAQIQKYEMIFNSGVSMLNFVLIFQGPLNDYVVGPRLMGITAGGSFILGMGCFGAARYIPNKWAQFFVFLISFCVVTTSGGASLVTLPHFGTLLKIPLIAAFFFSYIITAQDSGSLVFVIFEQICNSSKHIRFQYLFWGYGAVMGIFLILFSLFFQPKRIFKKSKRITVKALVKTLVSFPFLAFATYGTIGLVTTYFYFTSQKEQDLAKHGATESMASTATVVLGWSFVAAGIFVPILISLVLRMRPSWRGLLRFWDRKWWENKKNMRYGVCFALIALLILNVVFMILENIPFFKWYLVGPNKFLFAFTRAWFFGLWILFPSVGYFETVATPVGMVAGVAGIMNIPTNMFLFPMYANSKNYLWFNLGLGILFLLSTVFILFATVFIKPKFADDGTKDETPSLKINLPTGETDDLNATKE